jgi:hypothetical protein
MTAMTWDGHLFASARDHGAEVSCMIEITRTEGGATLTLGNLGYDPKTERVGIRNGKQITLPSDIADELLEALWTISDQVRRSVTRHERS